MATVIVQTSVGDPTANSYVSVADADGYLSLHPEFATWDALTDPVKGDWLIFATAFLDRAFNWFGVPILEAGTRFPRNELFDLDDRAMSPLPEDLARATAEVALSFAVADPFSDDETQYITEAKVDVLNVKWSKSKQSAVIPRSIVHRLSVFGSYRFGSRRIGKMA